VRYGARAHRARLDCSIERTRREAVVLELVGRTTQSQNLGVGTWVAQVDGPIVSARHQAPLVNYNRTHRNLTLGSSSLRLPERDLHPPDVFCVRRKAFRFGRLRKPWHRF
jgi:hypothetical protein